MILKLYKKNKLVYVDRHFIDNTKDEEEISIDGIDADRYSVLSGDESMRVNYGKVKQL